MADPMKLGLILSATDRMSRIINSATENANAKFKNVEKAMKGINSASNKILIAGGIAAAGIYKTITAAEEAQVANQRLERVFTQMWGNSGAVIEAAKQQEEFASKWQLQTGIDDEIIKLTQAKLATFVHVSNKTALMSGVFERATKAAHDLAAAGFGDAAQNAVMLGKALDSPMTMIKSLRRTGTVNDQDIIRIQNIFKTNGLLAAQQEILKAIERQVGGMSEKTATTTDLLKVGIGEIAESMGNVFMPNVDEAKKSLPELILKITDWIDHNHDLIKTITKVGAVLVGLAAVASVFSSIMTIAKFAMLAFNVVTAISPIGWLAIAMGVLYAVVMKVAWKFAWFRAIIKTGWEAIKQYGIIMKNYVIDRITGLLSGIGHIGEALQLLFQRKFSEAYDKAKEGVSDIINIEARTKVLKGIKEVATSIPGTFQEKLVKEKEADAKKETEKETPESVKAIQSNNNRIMNKNSSSNSTSLNYNPTINMYGMSSQDQNSFSKLLEKHASDIERIMKNINNRNARLSHSLV